MSYILLLRSAGVAGSLGTAWVGRNYYNITQAFKHPDQVDPSGRIGALMASRRYTRDQVGYGVHAATILIYLAFGGIGEQHVGTRFSQPDAIEALERNRNYINDRDFAILDQGHWINNQGKGKTLPDNIVICIGANIGSTPRAHIQEILAKIRESF
ncbi:hypothetical protein [Chryseobacterium wanjuense]